MPAPQGFHLQRPMLQEQITDSSGGTDEDTTFYQKQNTLECWIFLLNRGYRKLEREAKGLKKLSHIFMPFLFVNDVNFRFSNEVYPPGGNTE